MCSGASPAHDTRPSCVLNTPCEHISVQIVTLCTIHIILRECKLWAFILVTRTLLTVGCCTLALGVKGKAKIIGREQGSKLVLRITRGHGRNLLSGTDALYEDLARQIECIGSGKAPDTAQQRQHINTWTAEQH